MTARHLTSMLAVSLGTLAVALPATAGAYATVAPEPSRSSVSGLPDGRVYEEVSPPNKHGNEVSGFYSATSVAADGDSVLYTGAGALADVPSSADNNNLYVSERSSHGWLTRSAMPLPPPGPEYEEQYVGAFTDPEWFVASSDMSHLLFVTTLRDPYVGPPDTMKLANNIFLEGPDPFVEPEWVGRSLIEGAPEGLGGESISAMFIAGGSPDLKTIYFFYEGTLFPGASHLYEYKEGVLSDAGVLPGGEASSGSAAPAAQPLVERKEFRGLTSPAGFDNEVSADGSHLFFTRTDGAGTLELYVLVTAPDGSQSTTLVSQSQLPGHLGEPAPHGPVAMPSAAWMESFGGAEEEGQGEESPPSYAYASPDGSHAFFQSEDQLTPEAPEGSTAKTYAFDLDTGSLEYLPGVVGSIITSSADGSSFVFENTATTPLELDRWSAGPGGGRVTPITQLPAVSPSACGSIVCIETAYTSSDGSVMTFSTESPIAGFNDGGTHFGNVRGEKEGPLLPNQQVFRYDASNNVLSCVSCPPAGVAPSGNAVLSNVGEYLNGKAVTGGYNTVSVSRGMSTDGSRVFFDTPDPLVPQDVNGVRDVYEWENGTVFLISSGKSSEKSYLLGSSESGDDVFFTTTEGISLGDTDGGRDVYDARIPRSGDNPPPEALPCTGDVCQGPPSVPNLLSAPSSATFNGIGNLTPQPEVKPATKIKAKPKKKKKKVKSKKKKTKKVKSKRARGASGSSAQVKHGKGRGR